MVGERRGTASTKGRIWQVELPEGREVEGTDDGEVEGADNGVVEGPDGREVELPDGGEAEGFDERCSGKGRRWGGGRGQQQGGALADGGMGRRLR